MHGPPKGPGSPSGDSGELRRLREQMETLFRRSRLVERRLREVLSEAGIEERTVVVADPVPPLWQGHTTSDDHAGNTGEAADNLDDVDAPPEDADWWPVARRMPRALAPTPGWACHGLKGRVDKVVGVSVCGFDREEVERIVAMIAERQRRTRDFVPVFLTDALDFDVFRAGGFVFEYVPPPDRRAAIGNWGTYLSRRRALLERKWGVSTVIVFGDREFGE